jgi:hypothetical protein
VGIFRWNNVEKDEDGQGTATSAVPSENNRLRARTTSTGLQLKPDFNVKGLQQKFALMPGKYKEQKKAHQACRREFRGETGSAAEWQANTLQEAIDQATNRWPHFLA